MTQKYTDIEAISSGYTHSLFIKNGSLGGLGMGLCGEINTQNSPSPQIIKSGFQASAIIDTDKALWMIGRNDFYQLGDSTGTTLTTYKKITESVIDVALGNGYSLFIDNNHVLWGVGRNHRGQLGDGTLENRNKPVKIMDGVSKVFASKSGFFSACITNDNRLYTWGDNSRGQLGRATDKISSTPEEVMSDVSEASLGCSHMLALNTDYTLYAWGDNSYNQIGNGDGKESTPRLLAENVHMASAGENTSLILMNSGKISAWGRKSHNNFDSGADNAVNVTIESGYRCDSLNSVIIIPAQLEALPESDFALVSKPIPFSADYIDVEWESDHPEIASVDGNGIIRTNAIGEAVITAKYTDRFGIAKKAKAKVKCTTSPQNSITDISADQSWWVSSTSNSFIVHNAIIGHDYELYDLGGRLLLYKNATSSTLEMGGVNKGVYLIKSGTKVVKVMCN